MLFSTWVKGMAECDVLQLVKCGTASPQVFVFDPSAAAVFRLPPGELCWPIEFLVSCFHKKHIFPCSRSPPLSELGSALRSWKNRTLWKYVFKAGLVEDTSSPWAWLKSPKPHVVECNVPVPPRVKDFVDVTADLVFNAAVKSRRRVMKLRNHNLKTPELVRYSLQELRRCKWTPVLTDKDGGFALIEKEQLWALKLAAMNGPGYKVVYWHSKLEEEAYDQYFYAARALATKLEDRALLPALVHDRFHLKAGVIAKLGCTLKTHKPPGKVKIRPLHCGYQHCMKPGMRYIASILRRALKLQDHVLRDSQHLLGQLRCLTFPANVVVVKFDIKDFFMSGKHEQLLAACRKYAPAGFEQEFAGLLEAILTNQYVTMHVEVVPNEPPVYHEVRKVIVGSGMGLQCSGEVSDVCFLDMVEIPLGLNCAASRRSKGILYYGRFKDDGILFLDMPMLDRVELCQEMARLSSFFALEFELAGVHPVMLDVQLCRVPLPGNLCKFDSKVYVKSTNQWQPLSDSSMHPTHVHKNWPLAMVSRFRRLSSDHRDSEEAAACFINRLRLRCPNHVSLVQTCRASIDSVKHPFVAPLVLPYRPAWIVAGVGMTLYRQFQAFRGLDLESQSVPAPKLAWKLGGTHLAKRFAAHAIEYEEIADDNSIFRMEVGVGW
jgi:hypothetical protein